MKLTAQQIDDILTMVQEFADYRAATMEAYCAPWGWPEQQLMEEKGSYGKLVEYLKGL